MSVNKWCWTPECDKGICINDCDNCEKAAYKDTVEVIRKKHQDPEEISEGIARNTQNSN